MTNRHRVAQLSAKIESLYTISQKLLVSQIGLANVIDLLIKKGIVTHDEVKTAIEKINPKRVEEKLSSDREPAVMDANDVGHDGPEQEVHPDEGDGNTEPANA